MSSPSQEATGLRLESRILALTLEFPDHGLTFVPIIVSDLLRFINHLSYLFCPFDPKFIPSLLVGPVKEEGVGDLSSSTNPETQ